MVQNISAQRHQCTYPAVSFSLLTDTQYYKETREFLPYFYCLMFSAHGLQNDCPLPCSVTQMCLLGSFKLFALLFHFFFFLLEFSAQLTHLENTIQSSILPTVHILLPPASQHAGRPCPGQGLLPRV